MRALRYPSTRVIILSAIVLSSPALAKTGKTGKTGKRAREVVYLDVGAALRYQPLTASAKTIRFRADGRWQRVTKVAKRGETTITVESGRLAAAETRLLFRRLKVLARRARLPRLRGKAKDGPAATIAFYGFFDHLALLGRGDSPRQREQFDKIVVLLSGKEFSVPKRAKARWRVSSVAWTNAGEGARWSFSLDSNGLFETSSGGDIGSGYDMFEGERRVVQSAALASVEQKLRKLLAGYRPPAGKRPKRLGGGGSYEIVGLTPKKGIRPRRLSIDSRAAIVKKIALVIAAVRRRHIWGNALPFPVARIGYSAALPGSDVAGLVTISGHWRQQARGSKVRVRRLSWPKVVRLFNAVQRAVDTTPASAQPAPAPPKKRPRGVWGVSLHSFIPRRTRKLISGAKQRWLRRRIARIIERQLLGFRRKR